MKASIFLSLIILAAAASWGWKRNERLVSVREMRVKVAEEVRALGLEPDHLVAEGGLPSRMRSDRGDAADKIAAARSFTGELIAFAKEMKEMEKSGGQPDEEMQRRIMETMGRFLEMSPSQIREIIFGIKDSPELDDETRRGIVGFAIMMLANDHPQAALAVFAETSDMEGLAGLGDHIVASSLGKWAESDPFGALKWIRANSEKHGDLIPEGAKAAILSGAATRDVKLALSLMEDVELESHRQVDALMRGARGGEERLVLIEVLRADEKHAELLKSTLSALGGKLAGEGFEKSRAWLSSAGLSESETAAVAEGLHGWETKDDTGRWIEWMTDKLPPDRLVSKVGQMMERWTRNDYQAAGEWINGAAEGPAKEEAVRSYARTVAPYEPEAAADWALTLPAGKERDSLLRTIHGEWKKRDEGAAAEFAREQGIGE